MTLRTNDPIKQQAHAILDDVRAGIFHTKADITRALRILGEPAQ